MLGCNRLQLICNGHSNQSIFEKMQVFLIKNKFAVYSHSSLSWFRNKKNNSCQVKGMTKSMKSITTQSLHILKFITFSYLIMVLSSEKVIQRTYLDYSEILSPRRFIDPSQKCISRRNPFSSCRIFHKHFEIHAKKDGHYDKVAPEKKSS